MKNTERTYHILLRLLLILATCWVGYVQAVPQGNAESGPRSFDEQRLERYRNDPDYQYDRPVPEPPESLKNDTLVKRKPREYTAPRVRSEGLYLGPFFKVLFWILIIAGGGFLLFQIFKVNLGKLWKRKSDEAKVDFEDLQEDEDISEMELDDPIQIAIDNQEFRTATRLLYLRSLKRLQERDLIKWRREKTNREYLRELGRHRTRSHFKEITFIFEYIWYGEWPVDSDEFNEAYAAFLRFDQQLMEGGHDEN